MEMVATHASVIVPEVLTRDNYEKWSILMQHYLMGQGLWDVVKSSQLPAQGNMKDQWIKKNALVLHVIKFSCGEEIFDQIKGMDSAKEVWDELANMRKPSVVSQETAGHPLERRTDTFTAPTFGNLGSSEYKTLIKDISDGKFWAVQRFFASNEGAKSASISENGYTALHLSVYYREERIVDYLISKLSKEELEIKDDFGNTALSIAARFGVGKSIAQKLVGKNRTLLTISNNDGKIPVQLACSTINKNMARYLYCMTPQESLNEDSGFYILEQCISRKMFDIASDVLRNFPKLASHNCSLDSIPLILKLAETQPPFFRRNNLSVWERWTYDRIRVKAYSGEDEHRSCIEKIQDFCLDLFQFCVELSLRIVGCRLVTTLGHRCGVSALRIFLGIFGIFLAMPAVMMLVMMLLILLIADILILGALRILVSMLLQCFARDLYQLKLMDAYAREVIRLICKESFSKLDEIQFGQSTAVKAILQAILQAIKSGIPDIVREITYANVNILRGTTDPEDSSRKIFACAIAHHQEEVARFLYRFAEEETNMVLAVDEDKNNILHLAAKLAPRYQLDCISGSALQLQSELRWFKGIEDIVPRSYRENKNNDKETPLEVFAREHKDLLKEAEEWVKRTAESSTVVGALIITIMFAAAFTVPGGLDQSTGYPIFLHKTPVPFMVFMVSDAISLFAASSSVIMFLGILTSRFAYEDFHKSLPIRLVMGLSSLFISIATMTMAFCAALVIMLEGRLWVVILITLLAGIPVIFFVSLQFPLLVEIYVSTFRPKIFDREESFWERIERGICLGLWNLGPLLDKCFKDGRRRPDVVGE